MLAKIDGFYLAIGIYLIHIDPALLKEPACILGLLRTCMYPTLTVFSPVSMTETDKYNIVLVYFQLNKPNYYYL